MKLLPTGLAVNVRTNLRYYRRNRLLVVGAIVLLALIALYAIPTVLFSTTGQRFAVVGVLLGSYNFFVVLLTGVLGLVALSGHLRNRSYELVVTRPCPPETWLLSHFLSAALVGGVMCLFGFLLGATLFAFLGIPFQWGLLYLTIHTFCKALVLFAYLTFLSTLLHPVIALLLAAVLQEGVVWWILLWVSSGAGAVGRGAFRWILVLLEPVLALTYAVLPIYSPHDDTAERIAATFRVDPGDLADLGLTVLYTALLGGLLYLLATLALRRRPGLRR